MKRILLLGLILVSLQTSASHIMSGYIGVRQISIDSVQLIMAIYADSNSFAPPTQMAFMYTNTNNQYQYTSQVSMSISVDSTFAGFEAYVYASDTIALANGEYRFVHQHCCRNGLNNVPNATTAEFVIACDYTMNGSNTSPVLSSPLDILVGLNQSNTFDFDQNMIDFDGDQIQVSMDDALNMYNDGTGLYTPVSGFTQLNNHGTYSVASNTSDWTPNALGTYATGYLVEEFRNGTKIGELRIQHVFVVDNVSSTITHDRVNGPEHYQIFNWSGAMVFEGDYIPYEELEGFYVVHSNKRTFKLHVSK